MDARPLDNEIDAVRDRHHPSSIELMDLTFMNTEL